MMGMLIFEFLAIRINESEWALFSLAAGMVWLQACLEFYSGKSKPIYSAVARVIALLCAGAALLIRG
jgi:hypothetical protein